MRNLAINLTVVLIGVWGSGANAEDFVAPFSGQVYFKVTTAKTGADGVFGIGTTPQNCHVYLSSLPDTSFPTNEFPAGYFNAGETIRFCIRSKFGTNTAWAFSDSTDRASLVAFSDTTNALHMGGKIITQTSATTWLMHLDNAVSYLYDDSNDDILMQIRIDPSFGAPQAPATPASTPSSSQRAPIPPPLRLRDVRTVYVGTFGNGENAETIRAKVLAAIVKSKRITAVLSEEDADAVLTGTALTTECCSDATLRLVARANHKILWADGASDGLRLTLSQEISATSNRIVKKLLAAIEKDKH